MLSTMRRLLLLVVAFGMAGTALDLVLLEHYEGVWQVPPLALIAWALLVILWLSTVGGPLPVTVMRITMVCFVFAGVAGISLHYAGNSEFQREIDPTLQGWALALKVIKAKAPPALAPAVMIQLGLLGLLYTYRHPHVPPGRRSGTRLQRST
jgi:hypothetical protein